MNYPTTNGAFDTTHNGKSDVFITKLSPTGSSLIYSTFIGGSGDDIGNSVAIDSSVNIYISGWTEDSTIDYPATSEAYDPTHNGDIDVFVTKLNSAGSSLVYSTFLGGSGWDYGSDIAIDPNNNACINGHTEDHINNFPITNNAYDRSNNGKTDVFVTKLNSAGSSLVYSTFLGGSDDDYGSSLVVDLSGNVYITGLTIESTPCYPTTSGAYDTTHNGAIDVFVTKLNSAGSSLVYSTFIGGSGWDYGGSIAIDSSRNAYVIGTTESGIDFPITNGSFDLTHNGDWDVFITKLNSVGTNLAYSTFLGGSNEDRGNGIAIDSNGYIYITGRSEDGIKDYPTTSGSYKTNQNGKDDVFVTKMDIVPPIIGTDSTPLIGSTGDIFTFSINVTDNIGVSEVYLEYWYGGGPHKNKVMSGSGPYTYTTTIPSESIESLHYIFSAVDISGNRNVSTKSKVIVIDDDSPVIRTDNSSISATTGDSFYFSIEVTDNIGVKEVYVEYWVGIETHTNISMTGTSHYYHKITIPEDSQETLHYVFHALDRFGNYAQSSLASVQILDNDKPILIEDLSDDSGSTGDEFEFKVIPDDNIGIGEVTVEYWFGEYGSHENITMNGENEFTHTIVIPSDSILDLNYMFHFNDTSNNWNQTVSKAISITDNDKPVFIEDLSPSDTTTGSDCTISIEIQDNIGIDTVTVEYWFGTGDKQEEEMSRIGNVYEYKIYVPSDSTLPLNHVITASDSSGNTNSTEERRIHVIDDISPEIEYIGDLTIYQGDEIQVQVEATDNIEISDYIWEGNPISSSGDSLSGIASDPGTYYVNVTVVDGSGNEESVSFEITILPEDYDNDGDGIPDLIEKELGLDMNSSSDASLDPDSDDLTNIEEYLNGTEINDNDTDDDGMPDGWEVDNDLDPLTPSADNDADDDGLTDLDEYLGGTDPNIVNEKEIQPTDDEPDEKSHLWILLVIIIIVVILIAVVVVVALLIKKRRPREDHKEIDPTEQGEGSIPKGFDTRSEFHEND